MEKGTTRGHGTILGQRLPKGTEDIEKAGRARKGQGTWDNEGRKDDEEAAAKRNTGYQESTE